MSLGRIKFTMQGEPIVKYLKDYQSPNFFVKKADLYFNLNEDKTIVKSELLIEQNKDNKIKNVPLILDGENLELLEITLDDNRLGKNAYQITNENLLIANVPEIFILKITVAIKPQENTKLMGLYKSAGNFCTQCEPRGFHKITYFIDRPDNLTQFFTTIEADKIKYPVLLSNGNLISKKDLSNDRHLVKWEDPTLKPAYLFALVAGNLGLLEDVYQTQSGRNIKLQIYVEEKFLHQCEFALQALKQAMLWDEQNFGFEYELDIYMIVAINDFNVGAMENKGLNIFNSKYILVSAETATDEDYVNVARVVAHEYFHNVRGNRITCRDWFQLALKEGLTTFTDQLFIADLYFKSLQRIRAAKFITNTQFPEDSGPLSHPVRPNSYIEVSNFYTVTVYYKGAEIFHMLQEIIGIKKFRQLMQLFAKKFTGRTAVIEDVIALAEEISGIDLKNFMLWFDLAGTLVLDIFADYNAQKQTVVLQIKQSGKRFTPLAISLLNKIGDEINFDQPNILLLREEEQKFVFKNIAEKPVLSLLHDFTAPVKINFSYTDEELKFLMQHDRNDFSRWFAQQKFLKNAIMRLVADYQNNKKLVFDKTIGEIFCNILHAKSLDKIFISQLLQLPTEDYLLESMSIADPEAIFNVLEFLKLQIATMLKQDLLNCYQQCKSTKEYVVDAKSIGERSLKNLCLDYLVYLDTKDIYALALKQYASAKNMTEIIGALVPLVNSNFTNREELLQNFYAKWQNFPHVVDKWFALNASLKFSDTLIRVQKLLVHPKFNYKNPNNVYSLILIFCTLNHINFHDVSGKGYQFLTDQIIKLDAINPMVAAKLVKQLINWRKFDQKRQILMLNQLQKIHALKEKISKNVFELVEKSIK